MFASADFNPWYEGTLRSTTGQILRLFLRSWDALQPRPSNELEPAITKRLYVAMQRDGEFLEEAGYLSIVSEGTYFNFRLALLGGEPDFCFVSPPVFGKEKSFVVECKRLNVDRDSRAGAYAGQEGMQRFVGLGRYRDALSTAAMVGYVMDGNVEKAIAAVERAFTERRKVLHMNGGPPSLLASSILTDENRARETRHELLEAETSPFVLHHLFLPA